MSVDTANFSCLSDKVSAQPQVVKKGLLPDTMESPMAQTDAPVGAVLGDVLWARVRSVAGLQLDCAARLGRLREPRAVRRCGRKC